MDSIELDREIACQALLGFKENVMDVFRASEVLKGKFINYFKPLCETWCSIVMINNNNYVELSDVSELIPENCFEGCLEQWSELCDETCELLEEYMDNYDTSSETSFNSDQLEDFLQRVKCITSKIVVLKESMKDNEMFSMLETETVDISTLFEIIEIQVESETPKVKRHEVLYLMGH